MKADSLHQRALAIGECVVGSDHPHATTWLNNRAGLPMNHVQAYFGDILTIFQDENFA